MKFKKLLNQRKVWIHSKDITLFLGLVTYASFFVVFGVEPQTIWPQIDNLSGAIKLSNSSTNDYFTESSIHSPRIFTILFIKFLTIMSNVSLETVISFLGSLVAIVGLPLFVIATKKRLSVKNFSDLKLIEFPIYFLFVSLLSSSYLHKFEVNGFFINPFLQGATTANLSILLFLIGYLANKERLKFLFYLFSLLFHISTGLFMFLIFRETFNKTWTGGSKKFSAAVYLLSVTLVVLALGIYTHVNLPSWSYYIKARAANHFVITTSDKASLQMSLLILLIFSAILLLAPKYQYKYVFFLLVCSACISLTAYPLYSVPYTLASLCLLLKIKEKLCVPPILILFGLFVLQAFPSDVISIPIAMLLPATRFTSIVSLYLLCLLVLEIGKKANGITCLPFNNVYISKLGRKIAVILLIITTGNTLLYAKTTNDNFSALKRTITKETRNFYEINSELIFLDVPSQGWREFGNMQIFVDEYPFWGNLEEYRNRNFFRERLLKLAFTSELDRKKFETLKKVFDVNKNLVLVTTKKNLMYFRDFDCVLVNANYFCDLEATK